MQFYNLTLAYQILQQRNRTYSFRPPNIITQSLLRLCFIYFCALHAICLFLHAQTSQECVQIRDLLISSFENCIIVVNEYWQVRTTRCKLPKSEIDRKQKLPESDRSRLIGYELNYPVVYRVSGNLRSFLHGYVIF